MKIKFQGKEYAVVDIITEPNKTSIFTENGVFEIIGTDDNGDDFQTIMNNPREIEDNG